MSRYLQFVVSLGCLMGPNLASGEDWSDWRGPMGSGVAASAGFVTQWSADDNVVWSVSLPGPGASTPIVVGPLIYLTAEDGDQNALLALDRSGAEQWRRHVGATDQGKHRKATGCNSSPVSDGTHVVAYFKSGDLATFDLQGTELWRINLQSEFGEDSLWWDLGTTPLIVNGLVVITCQQTGPSYIAAFDVQSGELRWKQERAFPAPDEANQSYTTPCLVDVGAQQLLVVVGADHITAHQLSDGAEVWRVGELNPQENAYFRSIASPVAAGELVIAPYARGTTLTAVRCNGKGDVTDTHIAWQVEGMSADVPTPAFDEGRVYVCNDRGVAFCIDASTGKQIWETSLPKSRTAFSSSPIIADGHLYLVREDAVTFVLDKESGEIVAENELEGLAVATPVFVDRRILLRTREALFCLGEE